MLPETPCLDENLLSALFDRRLSEADRARLDAHVDRCAACRHVVAVTLVSTDDEEPALAERAGRPASRLSRYVILDVLGVGGSGIVYAGYDPELDRRVAIKLLRPGAPEPERILREAKVMARLSHPNVVAVHDIGSIEDRIYVVMELIQGGTLRSWLGERERPVRAVLDVLLAAGRGLAAAHEAGIVHRDFKPDNVLLGQSGRVLVTDFGLARALAAPAGPPGGGAPDGLAAPRALASPQSVERGLAGTPAYMAPEQIRGEVVDHRADIFSFCVTLYESLYGERPFPGDSLPEILAAIERGAPAPQPRRPVAPWVHRALCAGLRAAPAERPASMRELLAALTGDRVRRLRRAAALVALVIGVVGLGLGLHASRGAACRGAARKLTGVWDHGQRQKARGALLGTGRPQAAEVARAVTARLDEYAASWSAMRTEACEATRVTGEQSEDLLELRMRCLDHRLDELRGLTTMLSGSAPDLLGNASRAPYELSSLRGCADVAALRAPVPPPRDPSRRADVERLRRRLAQARALQYVARYRELERQAAAIAADAAPLGYQPLLGEALLLWGMALERTAEFHRAADTLRQAAWAAEQGGDRKLAVRARAQLVWIVGHQEGRHEQALEYAREAEAILAGMGGDGEIEALVASGRSAVFEDMGREAESLEQSRIVLRKREPLLGAAHPQTAIAMVNVAVGLARASRRTEALSLYDRALGVYHTALGPHHPLYAHTLFNMADAEMDLGRYREARDHGERARALLLEAVGPEHSLIAAADNVLGLVSLRQRRFAEAEAHLERALRLGEKVRGPRHLFVGHYVAALGDARVGLGRPAAALACYEQALGIYAVAGNDRFQARMRSAMGRALLLLGRSREAAEALEGALRDQEVGSSRVDLQACKLEYSIVSPK